MNPASWPEAQTRFVELLSLSAKDESVYRRACESIPSMLGADCMAIAFYDGWQALQIVDGCGPDFRPLTGEEAAKLASVAKGGNSDLSLCGRPLSRALVLSLDVRREHCGFIILFRKEESFSPEDRMAFGNFFSGFAVWMRMRKEQALDDRVRRDAERELRTSEERLRNFLEESRDMIYSSSSRDILASINQAGLSLLGVADRFEIIGRPFAERLLTPGDRQIFLDRLHEKGFVTDYECVYKRGDGTTIFCIETARAVRNLKGEIVEIQGIVKDISERIANERELWKTNLELAEANEKLKQTQMAMIQQEKLASIGQLAAGIAHEINNPLGFLSSNHSTISGFLRTLGKAWEEASALDPEAHARIADRHDLQYVLGEIDAIIGESEEGFRRIIDIVQNLKSFARLDAKPIMGPYDLNEGIKSTLLVARNEIKYVAEVELRLGNLAAIRALGSEINQVILNILVNAAQAIEGQHREGKGQIRVSTREEGSSVLLMIEDDGPGIPEDRRLKVFDPFYTTKAPGKGTGLGLSISYDIITRKHGGSISIGASDMGGALFSIHLPLAGPPDTQTAPSPARDEPSINF